MKAYVFHPDDGSTLYEWIDKDFRFGISVEIDPVETGWYFVHRDGTMESGKLPDELLRRLMLEVGRSSDKQ